MSIYFVQKGGGLPADALCIQCERTPRINIKKLFQFHAKTKNSVEHIAPPDLSDASKREDAIVSFYRQALLRAKELKKESVSIPLILDERDPGSASGFLKIASDSISTFLSESDGDLTVFLILPPPEDFVFPDLSGELQKRLNADEEATFFRTPTVCGSAPSGAALLLKKEKKTAEKARRKEAAEDECKADREVEPEAFASAARFEAAREKTLEELILEADEGFSATLLRLIDRKGMTDAQCYKKANVDRKLFSKIRSNPNYRPSKQTALAFAIALELSFEETEELLKKAGYALSRSQKGDIIVSYFIGRGIYDIFRINEALYAFDQALLGA